MKGQGCNLASGVCGKDATTAQLQDALVHVTKGVAICANELVQQKKHNRDLDHFIIEALFTAVTNVNFDANTIRDLILIGQQHIRNARELMGEAGHKKLLWLRTFTGDVKQMAEQALALSILDRIKNRNADITGLEELVTYGLKGMAAYAHHAWILGVEDDSVYNFYRTTLSKLTQAQSAEELTGLALKVGEMNLKVMGLLDQANTTAYGHPRPANVRITPVKGKAILVSGHDLKDLEELLKQTENTGVQIYTHSEMLPAHGYPGLRKYAHLAGNYGGAWQDQQKEFEQFPGAILMTTNCIQKPRESYRHRIFTTGLVQFPDVLHIDRKDFSAVIKAAQNETGFVKDEPEKTIMVGFGHNAVLGVADKVIAAVKEKKIRHFFLIGGCDGAKPGRNYYTDFAQAVPNDCVILTLACGKYRFNKFNFGDIGGIPRLLDIGQCNDAYSAIQIAVALSKAFGVGVNDLPLSMILSWYEQKAVAILLTLLHLGIKNLRLGPSLPAFVTPNVLNVLVEKFNIKPITTALEDLKAVLG
jgi:hydroxylamine reductase